MSPLTQWLFPRALRRRDSPAEEGTPFSETRESERERARKRGRRRSVDGSAHSSSRAASSEIPRRRSVDLSVLKGYARHAQQVQPKKKEEEKRMVKRRTNISVYFVDKPMLSSTEFLVDARYKHLKLIGAGRFGVVVYVL